MPYYSRKSPRLHNYDYSQPGAYFVTICAKDRANLFGQVVGGDVLIAPHVQLSPYGENIAQVLKQIPSINRFVIMPNHIHFVAIFQPTQSGAMSTSPPTVPTGGIPSLVRFLKRQVTLACGESVWQRSYHEHIIRNEKDYIDICQYIDNNPARWREDQYCEEF